MSNVDILVHQMQDSCKLTTENLTSVLKNFEQGKITKRLLVMSHYPSYLDEDIAVAYYDDTGRVAYVSKYNVQPHIGQYKYYYTEGDVQVGHTVKTSKNHVGTVLGIEDCFYGEQYPLVSISGFNDSLKIFELTKDQFDLVTSLLKPGVSYTSKDFSLATIVVDCVKSRQEKFV